MVKRIFTLACMLGCLLCVNAKKQYMTVVQKSGETINFSLSENPEVTYSDGNLVVNGDAETSYAIRNVKYYHFTDEFLTSVNGGSSIGLSVIHLDEATIQVKNARVSDDVLLSNVNGVVVYSDKTDVEGSIVVPLPEQAGVYVLTVGDQSIKIIRK